jgi:glycogen operon protein
LLAFVERLVAFRATQPVLRRRTFLSGRQPGRADVLWLHPDGREMGDAEWANPEGRALGMLLDGRAILETDAHGQELVGDSVLVLFNASAAAAVFTLPHGAERAAWTRQLDTASPDDPALTLAGGERWRLPARSASIWTRA